MDAGLVELFLVLGLLFCLLSRRATDMVDVLQNRLQEAWNTNPDLGRGEDSGNSRCTQTELRRYGLQMYKNGVKNRNDARHLRSVALSRIKEAEVSVSDPLKEPSFIYYCCKNCTPFSRNSLMSTSTKKHKYDYVDILHIPPKRSLFAKIFSHISHVYSFKKYNYPVVTETVLEDERLKVAIRKTALDTCKNQGCSKSSALSRIEKRTRAILASMQSTISDTLLKITAWVVYKLLPCFIQSACVQTQQLEILKKANETGLPLIFLPLHRSHLDYIVISFLCLSNNIRNPLVAAGNNLRIPFFGWLLSGLGAFYIKRRIDPVAGRKDIVYRAVLHTYIMECLRAGHNIEFFVEGGRTRTGKPCMPKGGVLSVIVDAYMDGTIEDALLVPMSINYDRLVDGNFVREQMGQPKKLETFLSTIRAIWNTLMGNYGLIKLDICQPFSIKEMLKSFQTQQNKLLTVPPPDERLLKSTVSSSSLYGTDVVIEEHRQLVDSIARHVVYDCTKSTPIMSTNMVAFLLLYRFREGCTLECLVKAFDKLWQELDYAGRDIAFCGETVDIVDYALEILGPGLVKQQRQEITDIVDGQPVKSKSVMAIKPLDFVPNVIELNYYGNTLLLHYVMDSVLVTALYSAVSEQMESQSSIEASNITVSQSVLVAKALKVCDILSYEFIFCKPCQTLEEAISSSLENLINKGVISTVEECELEEEVWSRRYAKNFDDSDDEDEKMDYCQKGSKTYYSINTDEKATKLTELLHKLLRSFIDTYTYSAFCLQKLVGRSLSEKDLIAEIVSEIKSNMDKGTVPYGESICVDPIKNSVRLFEKWNILECHPQENVKIYYLKDEYDNESEAMRIFTTIAAFKYLKYSD